MITIKRAEILFYLALAVICGAAIGLVVGTNSHGGNQVSGNPDWTVASCSLWAGESAPKLPPYTITTICVTDDGKLSAAFDPGHLHNAGVTK